MFRSYLLPEMKRMTNQKKLVLDFLRRDTSHPTAEAVWENVKKQLPQISRATVYRILDNFQKEGVIRVLETKPTRFDGQIEPHQHFICNNCGKIFDLKEEKVCRCLRDGSNMVSVGKVYSFNVNFYGLCQNCQTESDDNLNNKL